MRSCCIADTIGTDPYRQKNRCNRNSAFIRYRSVSEGAYCAKRVIFRLVFIGLGTSTAFAQDVNEHDFPTETEEGIQQVSFLQEMEFPAPAVPEFIQSEAVCCTPEGPCFSDHMHSIFGEYILFSPGNADLPYAEQVDGANAAACQTGQWHHCDPITLHLSVQAGRLLWTSAPASL